MTVVIKEIIHAANVDAVLPIEPNKKIYGFLGTYGNDVYIEQNGTKALLLNNSGVRQYMLPVPLVFSATAKIIISGATAATVAALVEE